MIYTLIHMPYLGKGGTSLGINFGTEMAVIKKCKEKGYIGTYDRIAYYETDEDGVPFDFPVRNEFYKKTSQDNFAKIPGAPVAYWVSKRAIQLIEGRKFYDEYTFRRGLTTADNDRFLRMWYEVSYEDESLHEYIIGRKWYKYNKGGEFRKWYGNLYYVIDWRNDGEALKKYPGSAMRNLAYAFQEVVSYSSLTSGSLSFRLYNDCLNDQAGNNFTSNGRFTNYYSLALLNSVISAYFIKLKNQTLNTTAEDFSAIPLAEKYEVDSIAKECVNISTIDWDSFETSWDFQRHPLVPAFPVTDRIADAFAYWQEVCDRRFNGLKNREEELNRIFIDIYGLQDELTPEVEDKDVTVRRADLGRDIRSLISYAVGCMLGRYSLGKPGLAFAGGEWNPDTYKTYPADVDGILPITDDEYFDDDIVGMFVNWVRTVYGADTLEENLRFIANALTANSSKLTAREVIRNYFLNDFYADHLKIYQKRPIYWLFSSGKKNGFKCLIYMHRYQPDLLARIRTDYVHEQQERYRTQLTMLEDSLQTASASERVKLNKQIAKLKDQALELQQYEEKIHHLADQMIPIDLDDGVKVNYAKFQDVLEKIK